MNLDGPAASGPADGLRSVFFSAPVPSGCTFTMVLSSDTASILMRHDLGLLQLLEHPVEHAALGPAVHARVDGVPVAKALGQAAPLATEFGNVQDGVQHTQIGQADVAALCRQAVLDLRELGLRDLPA
jgi:hypothetical protein